MGDLPASAAHHHAEPGGLYRHSLEVALQALEEFGGNMRMERRSDGSLDSFRESDPHWAAQNAAPTGPSRSLPDFSHRHGPTQTDFAQLWSPSTQKSDKAITRNGLSQRTSGPWRNGMKTVVADQYSRGSRYAARNALTLFVTAPTGRREAAQPQTRIGRIRLHLLSQSVRLGAASSVLEERGPKNPVGRTGSALDHTRCERFAAQHQAERPIGRRYPPVTLVGTRGRVATVPVENGRFQKLRTEGRRAPTHKSKTHSQSCHTQRRDGMGGCRPAALHTKVTKLTNVN